ncbi:hypothetical protein BT93_J0590 [Corymbia citriodora subsp. variegata]|nr:hypothetical protein BT93_J0590 [Corymbia citriodora subsp. variegata]
MGMVDMTVLCLEASAVLLGGKRKLRSLFWRARAEMKKQVLKNESIIITCWSRNKKKKKNQRFSFQYDPFSYALNFDNGNFGFFC